MTIHLKFGGSTAARTMNCPAWLTLADSAPAQVEGKNEPADLGTMLHNCMEEIYGCDDEELEPRSHAPILLEEGREYNGQHLTQDLVNDKLLPAIECVEKMLNELDIDDWNVEPFVKIDEDIGGSIDMLAISADKKTVLVLDYKFGFNSVAVKDNDQLKFYALAAACDDSTREWFDQCETITLAIVQPNDDGDDMQTWSMDMDALDNFESEYIAAVEASEEPDAMPKSGSHCKYCPAMTTCPVKTGAALKATRINELTADKLAEYLPLAAEVTAWAKEVNKMAHEQLELGTAIKGYKLVNKRASRVWNDKDAVESKIRKAKKIKLEDGFDMELKSPAQLEKKCKELKIDFDTYGEFISSVSSGTTLAKESDKRPAAIPVQGLAQLNEMNQ